MKYTEFFSAVYINYDIIYFPIIIIRKKRSYFLLFQ